MSDCVFCHEPVLASDSRAPMLADAHTECSLRQVLGGIGHLLDHAHFCRGDGAGPDAGLDYRTSSLLVKAFIERKGVEAAVGK